MKNRGTQKKLEWGIPDCFNRENLHFHLENEEWILYHRPSSSSLSVQIRSKNMILRTPPRQRRAAAPPPPPPSPSNPLPPAGTRAQASFPPPTSAPSLRSPAMNARGNSQQIVPYDDPLDLLQLSDGDNDGSDAMLCTYKCRQMVKSDVLETLAIREKEVTELQSRVKSLQEANSNQELQKKELEARIQIMEQELSAANGREITVVESYKKEMNQFQEWLQKQIKHCSELEIKLQHEMKLRAEVQSIANAANDKITALEEKMQKQSEIAEREITHLNSEISRLKKDSELAVSRIRAENERETCRANNAEQETELLKKQYEDLKNQLSESLIQKRELEQKASNASAEAQSSSDHESKTVMKHLQEELRHYEAEVAEARKSNMFHANAELLREKLLEEKQRADRAEAALEALPELQSKVTCLENELQSWRSMIDGLPGVNSYEDVPRKIAELQKGAVGGMAKVGEMGVQLKELQVSLERAEHERQLADRRVALAREEREEAITNIKRLERKVALLGRERDGLKAIISSYDEEEAVALKRQKVGDGSTLERSKEKRIQELEAALSESERNMKQLEQDLEEQGENLKNQHRKTELLYQEHDDALRKIKLLEREGDRLRSENAIFEAKLGYGDFNVATTKVLRMVNTLGTDNQTKDTIESLRAELQRLQAKLQVSEELKNQSESGDLADTFISETVTQLKAQIATLEKREERYKKVFAEKISVFRLACCALFGYKIQMDEQQRPSGIPVTLFTLQSIYAQNDDEKLEFEYESGNMNLQMNGYTSQAEIAREVNVFLHKFHSIPAFTANLTVELFNRSTMS